MAAPSQPGTAPRPATGSNPTTSQKSSSSSSGANTADPLSADGISFPPIYEAGVLYAANYVDATRETLKEYLKTNEGKGSIRAWLMLFDLYQLTNEHAEFDQLSMLYSVKFERSPPPWADSHNKPDPRRGEKRERKDFFQINPANDGALLGEIDRLEPFAVQMQSCRLDFSNVRTILAEEAELFSMVLLRLRRNQIPIWLNDFRGFAGLLKQQINESSVAPSAKQGYWSLLFELLILDGKFDEYEELGLEYAIAFEMSPPAWEVVERPTGLMDASAATDDDNAAAGYPLKGVVSTNSREMLQQLTLHAQAKHEVLIDMSALMRIDFNAITLFFETIRAMHMAQKRVILSNVNELVAVLLEIFGMTKHAIIMRKKTT